MAVAKHSIDKKSAGNAALYRYLAERPKLFLIRNIRVVLDRHDQERARMKTREAGMMTPDESPPRPRQKAIDKWNAQDKSILREFIHNYDAAAAKRRETGLALAQKSTHFNRDASYHDTARSVLIVKRLVLRSDSFPTQDVSSTDYGSDNDSGLGWVHEDEKKRLIEHPMTTCIVTLFADNNNTKGDKLTSKACLGEMSFHDGRLHIVFKSEFEASFATPVPRLGRAAKQTQSAVWLRIIIKNSDRQFAFLSSPKEPHTKGQGREQIVYTTAVRVNITDRVVKHTFNLYKDKTNALPKLDAVLAWRRRPKNSLLSEFNRAIGTERPFQLPTPNASEDLEHDKSQCQITYLYKGDRQSRRQDFGCPLCRRDLGITSFERLQVHFQSCHDYFVFHCEDDLSQDPAIHTRKRVRIQVSKGKDSLDDLPKAGMSWIAPQKPFDPSAYLAGNSEWVTRKLEHSSAQKKRKSKSKTSMLPARPVGPRLRPDRVPDLHIRQPPKFAVPRVRDRDGNEIKFYRTSSKAVLKTGSREAESDEELDESWLLSRQQQYFRRLSLLNGRGSTQQLSPEEEEFILDWNTHVKHEEKQGADGDRQKREGVIRFARRFRLKLSKPAWQSQFEAKLRRLVRYHLLDEADVSYCLGIHALRGQTIDEDTTMTGTDNAAKAAVEEEPELDLCLCGKRVHGKRGTIYCDNPKCPHAAFHIECLDLKSREPGWLCPDCAHNTTDDMDTG